jgi:CRISPR-associated protein Csd1
MSWIQKLYETYEACHALDEDPKKQPWPVSHFVKQAHIEVVLDGEGNFRKGRTRKLEWNEAATLIPATEKSAGRTAGVAPHPLCEEIGYMAIDLPEQGHLQNIRNYFESLENFCASVPTESFTKAHAKLKEITLSFKQWLGMGESDVTVDGSKPNDDMDEEDEKAPKVADLEKSLAQVHGEGQQAEQLRTVPEFLGKQNLRFAKKNAEYFSQLEEWCTSSFRHLKTLAVLSYLRKGSLWADLAEEGVFPLSVTNGSGQKAKVDDDKVFIRWRIEIPGEEISGTWEDPELIEAWIGFDASKNNVLGLCSATGVQTRLAQNHPRFLRYPGDGAKIISANDYSGFTFKGRFTDDKADYEKQVCSVGFEVSQKAHNALRWLIARQGHRSGDLAIVSWAVSGQPVPDPCASSLDLFSDEPIHVTLAISGVSDSGQSFALRLKRAIAGYGSKLDPSTDIVVMGIDSATPGRMGITFYREIKGSEFLSRIEDWHTKCAWPQYFGKDRKFVGAPAPRDIAEAAYGRRLDESLSKATVERLLPCIVDGTSLPRDLVETIIRRTNNRVGFKEHWEWEKCLGIACALFKGYHKERSYQMALEQDRVTRDYLYGRLLAVAENIESRALFVAGEKRDTMAGRLMQRFADRPYSTWKTIELSLAPYKSRMRVQRSGFLFGMDKLMDEVMGLFRSGDFTMDSQLSGEFLLGYHCQRQALRAGDADSTEEQTNNETIAN